MENNPESTEIAVLGGGCFWCLEALFSRLRGVRSVQSGYCGGTTSDPDYRKVCSGLTGHAETVEIEFDPAVISYNVLLEVFFASHDPTTLNRQGHDVGSQYRSAIFCLSDAQRRAAQHCIAQLEAQQRFAAPIVTEIAPPQTFYPAEAEHHDYYLEHQNAPYCQAVIHPKLVALQRRFAPLIDS